MNKGKRSPGTSRSYDNSFRQEQARRTRGRILDAAIEAIADPDAQNVTLAEVARRAGVSEPTLYRHFGSRNRLYDELEARAQERLGLPPIPDRIEELPAHVRRLFARFGEDAELLRAVIRTGLGREVRAHGKTARNRRLRELLRAHAPELDEAARERAAAALRVLVSYEAFERLTGELGLSSDEAGEAVAWAVEAVLARITLDGRNG